MRILRRSLGPAVLTVILALSCSAQRARPSRVPQPPPTIHIPPVPPAPVTSGKASFAPPSSAKYAAGRILVKFRRQAGKATRASLNRAAGATVLRTFRVFSDLQVVGLPPGMAVGDAVRQYRNDPNVEYAEPDYALHIVDTIPTDPQFTSQWALKNTGQTGGKPHADIQATDAWGLSIGDSSIVIGVIDSGVDYTHPDLSSNVFFDPDCGSGTDTDGNYTNDCHGINTIYPNNPDPFDDNGHGTHVAGTIGAVGDNGVGVTGVSWRVTILPCKFLDATGVGYDSGAVACLDYMAAMKDAGMNIVATNNSWGGPDYSQALHDAIQAQLARGILFIAAAGNGDANGNGLNNDLIPHYPAAFDLPNIIAVAATDSTDARATFSNFGPHSVALGAPGVKILSTFPGNQYAIASGTSMATPHVTGTVALLKAQDPTRTWQTIKNLILSGGDPDPSLVNTISQKRLNAYGAMTCSNQPLQRLLQPTTTSVGATSGTIISFEYLDIDCGAPNGPVTASIEPGGQTLTLLDDGSAPDQAANDGIYSAQWVAQNPGIYTFTFPDNETVTVPVLLPYYYQTTAFSYRTITGTNLNLGNDQAAAITSPFPIQFGGATFNTLYVSSNGTISVDHGFNSPQNSSLPYAGADTLIAPFWTDLAPVPNTTQNVFWAVTGTAPNRELVVEWRNVPMFRIAQTDTFEVVFQETTGNILFEYQNVPSAYAATVGIQVAPQSADSYFIPNAVLTNASALQWQIGTDFAISASSPSVYLGNTVNINGNISAQGAYDSPVALTCTGTPPSISCTPTTVNLQPFQTYYTLPVTYSGAGDYSFNVQAVGQDQFARTHILPVTLSVMDYSLNAPSPTSVSVPRGLSSSSIAMSLSAQGSAYHGYAFLSCDANTLPAGVTCNISPSFVMPTSTTPVNVTLILQTSTSTPTGDYSITVIAKDPLAPTSRTQTVGLTVALNPDFALSATPANFVSSPLGGSTTATINTAAVDGFSSGITLSCSIWNPNGLATIPTCSIPNTPVTPPGTATLTLNANGAAGGTYRVDVQGTSGGLSHVLSYGYGLADFSYFITASPGTRTIPGGTLHPSGELDSLGGFSGSVTFQCDASGIDPAATCSLDGQSIAVSSAAALNFNVTVPSNVGTGSYPVKLHATSGSLSHDVTFQVQIYNYTIQLNTLEATVVPGQPLPPFQVTITPDPGFVGQQVNLFCTGPVFCGFGQLVTVNGPTTVTMNVTAEGPAGTDTALVKGASGGGFVITSPISGGYILHTQDFTVGGLSNANLMAGDTYQGTLTVSPLNGFTGSVTLTCTTPFGMPPCQLGATTVPVGGSTTVTVQTQPNTSGSGQYGISASASANNTGFGHSTGFNLTITNPSSLLNIIPWQPTNVAVQRGTTANYQVIVNGSAGPPYTVSCVGLNPAFTCSAPQLSLGVYTIAVSTTSSSPPGTYNFSISASAGGQTKSLPAVLTVSDVTMTSSALTPAPVLTGNTATVPLTVTGFGGFNVPVSLSCPWLPVATSCAFSPAATFIPSGGAGSAVTLAVNTSSVTPGGVYSVPIVLTANNYGTVVTQTLMATVTVKGFHLGVSPSSLTVPRGTSNTFAVAAFSDAGFSGNVSLACTGAVPAGISCGFNPSTVAPTGTGTASTLTITANGTAFPGPSVLNVTATSGGVSVTQPVSINVPPVALRFVPMTPCRVADTRNAAGPFGGPFIAANATRSFPMPSSTCNIPSTAQAYSVNLTVVPHGSLGYLTAYPCGQTQPLASNLNSTDGRVKATAAIVPAGDSGAICMYVTNDTDLVIDVNGYFVDASTPTALAFYPLPPCRLVDSRLAAGPLGGPSLVGKGAPRVFPILAGTCNVPAGAQAYSLNYTSVPKGALGYLTTWPTGQTQPLVSTLNAPTGAITANAAIVPAGNDGNGSVSVYVTDDSDLVIDINGYFAPPGTGGLSLYTLTPCRVLDTRTLPGGKPFSGQQDANVARSGCGADGGSAQALVLNATVVPPASLGYLTLWPQGAAQPFVSTLNAADGKVTSNLAIVPTTNGSVSAYGSNATQLVLDLSAYFAP